MFDDGGYEWRVDGVLHRKIGPAVCYANGHKEWHYNGKLHNLNGPAVVHKNGDVEYWEEGVFMYEYKN